MKKENDTEKIYNYCDCCGKPVNPADHDCYTFCKECASRLLKNIFGEEVKPHGN